MVDFLDRMRRVFGHGDAEAVHFYNPLHDSDEVNTIYVAQI